MLLHLKLFIFGVALIVAGLMIAVVLKLGGAWVGIAVFLEAVGVILLGVNVFLMMRTRKPGEPPK